MVRKKTQLGRASADANGADGQSDAPKEAAPNTAPAPPGRMVDRLGEVADRIVSAMTKEKLEGTPVPGLATALGVVIDRRKRLLDHQMPTEAELIEVIHQHVKDPDVLRAIAQDLDDAYAGAASAE